MSARKSTFGAGGATDSKIARNPNTRKVRARKELGQHFLVDRDALDRIVAAAYLGPNDTVLEIGAGTGELTNTLLATGASVAAVELDERLCRHLRDRFGGTLSLHVVCANILDHAPTDLLLEAGKRPPYLVVANIPYYITAPILRKLLEAREPPIRIILTVQREVADAIVAKPGSLSLLAVSIQVYATARLLFYLPPSAFRPPPKVASAVINIELAPRPFIPEDEREPFFEVVRAGFRSPRKQLHNALSQALWLPPDEAAPLLQAAGIDPMRRAQTLDLQEWRLLSQEYARRRDRWRREARAGAAPPIAWQPS